MTLKTTTFVIDDEQLKKIKKLIKNIVGGSISRWIREAIDEKLKKLKGEIK